MSGERPQEPFAASHVISHLHATSVHVDRQHLPYASEPLAVIERLMPLMARIWSLPRGQDAIAAFLSYFLFASEVTPDDLRISVRRNMGPAAEETVMSTADKLIREGEARGEARGRFEGRASTLLKQLQLKFGQVSPAVTERVNNASIEELDRWAERILSATSTADTLDP